MKLLYGCLALLIVLGVIETGLAKERRAVDYVNPFVGTDGHGHTYPGATVPFGMVQLSPDNGKSGWDWCSGYHYSCDTLVGFSHTHLSGTGCADLGDILFMPAVGSNAVTARLFSRFRHEDEHADPGFYSVRLEDGIKVELTATERAGFHRYTFSSANSASVVIDLGHGQDDTPTDTYIKIESPTRVSGYRISSGWAREQYCYFTVEFSEPITYDQLNRDGEWITDAGEVKGKSTKAFLRLFGLDKPLLIKVGISPVSVEGAQKNLSQEIPGWDFDAVKHAASDAWQKELSKVKLETKDTANAEAFYTALYHTMLAPTLFCDVDGQYRGGDGQVHPASNFQNHCTFSLWDTYRAAHPLYTILQPQRVPDLINSMLAFYRDGGLLPVWSLTGNETWCMIGYHSVPVIADAYFKGFTGFDPHEALAAMKKSALQDKRGLQFYNRVTPEPLDKRLAELRQGMIEVPDSLRRAAISGDYVLPGYAKSISGEVIHYHSHYPYVNDALLVRATDGKMQIEWETPAVPADLSADTVTFMWVAGLCTFRGGHRFDLFVNDEPWLSFNSSLDTTRKFWSVTGENGATLSFIPRYIDVFDDFFGEAFLKVPAKLLKKGEPLNLRVVGEKGNSSDWYMTFQHQSLDTVSAAQEFALARSDTDTCQVVRIIYESLFTAHDPAGVVFRWNQLANVITVTIKPGFNTWWLDVPLFDQPTVANVSAVSSHDIQGHAVTLHPVSPHHFIPADKERESVSKALEYAYDDWCIAQMAEKLGKTDDAREFAERAGYYSSLFDSSTGFMRGRNSDGSWVTPFDPRWATEKQPQYTEGNAWQYSWYVPQDVPGLIQLMGGEEKFCTKLDSLFNHSEDTDDIGAPPDVSGLIGMYAHGNEPSHHIAYLYDYAGQPWKTQATVRQIMRDFYTNQPDGLCGNEDCGQMSAWYIFSAMGFYPVNPADSRYFIGSPLFEMITVDVGNGKRFTILAHKNSPENVYIQSVKLNGVDYNQTFITHGDVINGGTLEFVMGPKPNLHWGLNH